MEIKEKFYGKKKYKNTQRNENPMAKKEKKNLRKSKNIKQNERKTKEIIN